MPDDEVIDEEKILEEVEPAKEKKKRHTIKSQQVIREHLLRQEDNRSTIYDCYKACKEYYTSLRITPPRYSSVRVIIHVLRRFKVIRDIEEQNPSKIWTKHRKKVIELIPGQATHPIWDDLWGYYTLMRKGEGK